MKRAGRMLGWVGTGAVAIALTTCVPSLKAHAAVFGTDERTNVPTRLEATAARIGLLFNNQSRTVCTAFCVADNIVATAAHCLLRAQNGTSARHSDFMFGRNYDRTRDFTNIEGSSTSSAPQNVASGDFQLRVRPPIDAAHDWALLRLQRNTCTGNVLPVRALSPDQLIAASNEKRIFQISYHRDWAQWRPAYSKPCRVSRDFESTQWSAIAPDFIDPEQMILHTCDTGGASSGSPLLLETPEGPVVVGLNVGTYVQSKTTTQDGQVTLRQKAETIANTAVNAEAFVDRIEALKTASILTAGQPIRDLQTRLTTRGFYSGKIDGAYGQGVKAAIEAYERANQMPVTGLASARLLSRLTAEAESGGTVVPSSSESTAR
jgi:V8-like Glu-specific endopeptidase